MSPFKTRWVLCKVMEEGCMCVDCHKPIERKTMAYRYTSRCNMGRRLCPECMDKRKAVRAA
jgi:hypothetical protein